MRCVLRFGCPGPATSADFADGAMRFERVADWQRSPIAVATRWATEGPKTVAPLRVDYLFIFDILANQKLEFA